MAASSMLPDNVVWPFTYGPLPVAYQTWKPRSSEITSVLPGHEAVTVVSINCTPPIP